MGCLRRDKKTRHRTLSNRGAVQPQQIICICSIRGWRCWKHQVGIYEWAAIACSHCAVTMVRLQVLTRSCISGLKKPLRNAKKLETTMSCSNERSQERDWAMIAQVNSSAGAEFGQERGRRPVMVQAPTLAGKQQHDREQHLVAHE